MSRRLLLRITPKLFAIPTIYHPAHCLLSLHTTSVFSSNATISRGHARAKHISRRRLQPKAHDARSIDRLNNAGHRLSSRALSKLRGIGVDHDGARHLLGVIRLRITEARGLRFLFDCLRNRETWLQNPLKIPKAYRQLWDVSLRRDHLMEYDLGAIGPHSDEVISQACHIMALDILMDAEVNQDIDYMSWGCSMLELAVLYGRSEAAAHLLNYYNDPLKANMLAQASLQTSTRDAEVLVRDLATQRPHETPPGAMLAYLRDEYSPHRIGLQNPKQLQWGFKISKTVAVPSLSVLQDTVPFNVYTHPAQIRLQILEHCLRQKISLPDLPLEKMPEQRDLALVQLAAVNDPRASMILAARENGPELYSDTWQRLVLAAAAGGIPQACRLLAIHYMRKEGILPLGPEASTELENSLGFEFGRVSVLAYVENAQSFVGFTVALAALCRTIGHYDRGLSILEESFDIAKETAGFPRSHLSQIGDHIKDYKTIDRTWVGYWDEKKINNALESLDPDKSMEIARKIYK